MSASSEDHEINWQEAVARLAHERTLVETAVGLLKKYGNAVTVDHFAVRYAEAKAEYDGIIGGLIVALAQRAQPESLEDLQERLRRAFVLREGFCNDVNKLLPPPTAQGAGEKNWITDIVKGAIGPVMDAVKAIWLRSKDDNALRRKTIETQLVATRWPDFTAIDPAP